MGIADELLANNKTYAAQYIPDRPLPPRRKLAVVTCMDSRLDTFAALAGSSNWDQRSLRLNFEANIECYDGALAQQLEVHFASKRALAAPISLDEVRGTPRPMMLRNAFARMFAPYL